MGKKTHIEQISCLQEKILPLVFITFHYKKDTLYFENTKCNETFDLTVLPKPGR